MKENIAVRVEALRTWMRKEHLQAFIVPTADPHGSEYVPEHWKCREWLTGFTGSAGTAVVTADAAALWTDSRYFIQAAKELGGTPFILMREGEANTPTVTEWLREKAATNGQTIRTGICGLVCAADYLRDWDNNNGCMPLVLTEDPFATLWTNRPPLPCLPVKRQKETYMASTASERIRKALDGRAPSLAALPMLLTDLSEIAWTLGLRGNDIAYNPVFVAYLLLNPNGSGVLFTDNPVPAVPDIIVRPYGDIGNLFRELEAGAGLHLVETANAALGAMAKTAGLVPHYAPSPVPILRAVKDKCEQAGFRTAMERDGVALVKFHCWLDEALERGEIITEQDIDRNLTNLRAKQEGFESLSFATIAASGEHGAIVHYEADPAISTPLPSCSFLLLDSGAQYDCGTTDITRTIPLGPLTDEERHVYTLVLKAHIGLARLRFPEGTNGLQADTAARAPLWQAGYDFGHGTGHGVGSHLCVHEGPHQIRKDKRACTSVPLQAGMTITDEPGVYLEGLFGVRLENVLLIRKAEDGFLEFEPLTLCPFDTSPIIKELLTHEELDYLNAYHAEVCRRLLPLLDNYADRKWLVAATETI